MIDGLTKNEKNIFVDTNVFYYMCLYCGILSDKETGAIEKIRDEHFHNFIKTNLDNEFIGISHPLLFEIVSKYRKDIPKIKKMMTFIRSFPVKIQAVEPFFNLQKKAYNNIMKIKITRCTINAIVKDKIHSEAELLFIFAVTIVHAYLIIKYKDSGNDVIILSIYNEMINEGKVFETIKNYVTGNLKKELKKGYSQGNESSVYKKYFSESIEDVAWLIFLTLDFIKSRTGLTKKDCVSYLNQYKNYSKRDSINAFHRWYIDDIRGKEKEADYFEVLSSELVTKGYTKSQIEHLKNLIENLFIDKKKISKNDSTDFVLLGYIRNDNYLLTFDENMQKAIQIGDNSNYNFIRTFYKQSPPIEVI